MSSLAMFKERERTLKPLAQANPYRHPANERTWWDWQEIRRWDGEEEWLELEERQASLELLKAIRLAPSLEVAEALLAGERVPRSQLDPEWMKRYGK